MVGRKEGSTAVTLESCALPNLGFEVTGSWARRDRSHHGRGHRTALAARRAHADLLVPLDLLRLSRFGVRGINVEAARNRCGAALARADDVEVDLVAGSGFRDRPRDRLRLRGGRSLPAPVRQVHPHLAKELHAQDQRVRDLVARMKLIRYGAHPGKRLLLCEDSIVRGTQLKDVIRRIFDLGAREVHMRPACPPLVCGCKFLNFSRSRSEMDLAGRRPSRRSEGTRDAIWPPTPTPGRGSTRRWSRASASGST